MRGPHYAGNCSSMMYVWNYDDLREKKTIIVPISNICKNFSKYEHSETVIRDVRPLNWIWWTYFGLFIKNETNQHIWPSKNRKIIKMTQKCLIFKKNHTFLTKNIPFLKNRNRNRNRLFENQKPKTAFLKTDPSFENTSVAIPTISKVRHWS